MSGPKITIEFMSEDSVRFMLQFNPQPTEGQFEVAGQELFTIGHMLRELRVQKQLNPKVEAQPVEAGPDGR